MHCPTRSEYDSACKLLENLGYTANQFSPGWLHSGSSFLISYLGIRAAKYRSGSRAPEDAIVIPYNLDLLKALAAMREGEEFYPGELVKCVNADGCPLKANGIYELTNVSNEKVQIKVDDGDILNYYKYRFQKLTVEEILANFNVTPSTGDNETFTPTGYTVNNETPAISSPAPKLPAFLLKTAENELEALRDLKKQNQHEIDTLRETGRDFDARIEELQAFLNHYKA